MDKNELVEAVAKYLHDLMRHSHDWTADTKTYGGIHWMTGFTEGYREEKRAQARGLIALVQGAHSLT